MSILQQIVIKIIKEQELIIGPLAWIEASKVAGLHVIDQKRQEVQLDNDQKQVVDGLVNQYKRLFGLASQEVCRQASKPLLSNLPPAEVPTSLR
jgi:hypothetical protein